MRFRYIVFLSVLVSTPAFGVTKRLGVTLKPQETNSWCWAASAQMVMSFLGGTTISQCDEVNYRCDHNTDASTEDTAWAAYNCGNVDCCQIPTPSQCIHGGRVDTDLDHWYFDFDWADGAVTWQHLKDEIDAGRPVIWAESFIPSGGHVLVASGYRELADGSKKVWVNDPWGPNAPTVVGDNYWLSYADYDHIDGVYTHQDDLWHIADLNQCHSTFHHVAASQMQDCFNYWGQRGRYLETLSANNDSGSLTMQGAFRSGTNSPYVRWNATSANYQTYFDTYANQGYRPKQVTATNNSSGDPVYTAIFVKTSKGFISHHNQTLTQLQNDIDNPSPGYVLSDLSIYDDNGTTRAAATWTEDNTAWRVKYGMTQASFATEWDTNTADGYEIYRFNAYNTANGVRYVALWHPGTSAWAMYYDMSFSGYQSQSDTELGAGYAVRNITALDNTYAATWEK